MPYMRAPWFVSREDTYVMIIDTENKQERRVYIPISLFDEIVIMRWAEIRAKHIRASRKNNENTDTALTYMHSIAEKYMGEEGADELRKMFGLPTVMDLDYLDDLINGEMD